MRLTTLAMVALAGCPGGYDTGEPPDPQTVQISHPTAEIGVLETIQLSVTVDGQAPAGRVIWQSNYPAFVVVSSTGLVSGVASGEATVTASISDREFATAIVSVSDLCADAIAVSPSGEAREGRLEESDCTGTSGGPVDTFTFGLAATTSIRFTVLSSAFPPKIELLDGSNTRIAQVDAASAAILAVTIDAGDYTVAVSGSNGGSGDYDFAIADPCADTPSSIAIPQSVSGVLEAGDCWDGAAWRDRRTFSVTGSGSTVGIEFSGDQFLGEVVLYDASDNLIAFANDASGTAVITATLGGGTYTIDVRNLTGSGSYLLETFFP